VSAVRTPAGTPARDALQGAITAIAAAGCETPRLDAEVLLAHVLGVSRERLLLDHELLVAGPAVRAFQDVVRRRAVEREPVAYIVGHRDFRGIELAVDRRALVPRPETETLVEAALALSVGASVLDVGTGSGAIALALKHERPDLDVAASDVSEQALTLAGEIARRLGLDVRLVVSDLLAGVGDEFERASLAPEIVRHEPPGALFAGGDGLDAIGTLARQLAERERVRFVALEVGAGQAAAVAVMLGDARFENLAFISDLAGIERVVTGERA
jgi:release factor glutamine methyltransferase